MKHRQAGFSKNAILALTMVAVIPLVSLSSIPLGLTAVEEASNTIVSEEKSCDVSSADNKRKIGGGKPGSSSSSRGVFDMLFLPYKS